MKMRLCGHEINVIEEDPSDWSVEGMGRANISDAKVRLKKEMPADTKNGVLLHETIHMIADMSSIHEDFKEHHVSILANSLFAWMKDNQRIVYRMLKGINACEDSHK